ncbi:MAG TPA: RHS repeat-associated core domain-containing protein [Candidatus Nanopelagicales bacterium]|nr:RHS repeat-associated core domain-containing protein [Candidatus Nanopelagicales bacterium]
MGKPKSDGKEVKTTEARAPANGTSKVAPTQTTNVALGGAGMGAASPGKKNKPAKRKCEGDPVSVVDGAVVEEVVDLELPGLLFFTWRRRYSSSDFAKATPFGRGGWTHDHHQWIEPEGDGWSLHNFDGNDLSFGPIPPDGSALNRSRRLLLRRNRDRFEVLSLDTRITHTYAPSHSGGRAWLRTIADSRGNRITLHYDGESLTRITDTAGREIHLQMDAHGRILAVDVEVGAEVHRAATYGYTDAGELAFAADGLGRSIRYAYDGKHRIIQKWLRNGFSIRYEYDPGHGRVVRTWGDGGLHHVELTYDFDQRTTTTHGQPQPRIYHWDAQDNVLREETFDGRYLIERTWDEDYLLLSEKDAAGEEHRYEYDARGFLTKHTDPAGNVTRYEHVDDLLRRVVRPNGNARRYEPDGYGSLCGLTLETGARYTVDRDQWGRIVALYGPEGLLERHEYDAHHNLIRVTGPRGEATSYAYDVLGRPTMRSDPLGRTTRLEHDAASNITAVTYPDGTRVGLDHDGIGKVTRIRKPGGEILLEYIGTGALARAVMEDGGEWRIGYDREEKPVRIENPKDERYEFRYDRAGRVVEERAFDGRVIRYSYDLSGRLHRVERPDGTWRELTYDRLGNVVEDTSPHGPRTFRRDAEGRLLEARLEEGPETSSVIFERDAFGRVVAETQDRETIRYEYDAENRVVARTLPIGEVTRYGYDLGGELAWVEHGGHTMRMTRDAAGQERMRHIASSPTAVASSYDVMGRLLAQDAVPPVPEGAAAVSALLHRRWAYDTVGRPERIEDARWGLTEYFYDRTHNLIGARRGRAEEAFEYDPAGGLVRALRQFSTAGERWAVREGDVLIRTESAAYEVDAFHRRTKKTELESGHPTARVTEYLWDCRDQLREVRLPDGDVVRYYYDAFGRRTRKEVYPPQPPSLLHAAAPPRVVRFLWEGDVLAAEIDAEHGVRAFVHEPETFRPLLQIEQGEVFLCVLDQVGAPRELLDAQGRVAWAAAYAPWGRVAEVALDPQARRARPVASPFRLLGQYADEETGLHCTRFRYWDPEVGRWCSPDPLGIEGGGRLFGLRGSPTFRIDPLGLVDLDEDGYYVYALFRDGEKDPYYVGITNDPARREEEHRQKGGRLDTQGGSMLILEGGIKYKQARGYEQAYMEWYGTRPANTKEKREYPGNVVNSFRHERAEDENDMRGKAFQEAYKKKIEKLERIKPAKQKQGCHSG